MHIARVLTVLLLVVAAACSTAEAPQTDGYAEEEIDYFLAVALGSEYGGDARLHRWTSDVRIHVGGEGVTAADRALVDTLVAELDALTETVTVRVVEESGAANVRVHLAPRARFAALEPNYQPGNDGFVWVDWDGAGAIVRGNVLVASEGISRAAQRHLLREELTQSLGLLRDVDRYPESIFYGGWMETTTFAPIDRVLVEMLYREALRPGMEHAEVRAVLERLERRGAGD